MYIQNKKIPKIYITSLTQIRAAVKNSRIHGFTDSRIHGFTDSRIHETIFSARSEQKQHNSFVSGKKHIV